MYLQQLQQKSFFFRFLVKFFTLASFMHSAFQDLRRDSRVSAFTISGIYPHIASWCVLVTEANNSVA